MISSYLQGGLGNQMFQIAAAVSLSADINSSTAFCESNHNLPLQGNSVKKYKNNVFSKINFIKNDYFYKYLNIYSEKSFSFQEIPKNNNLLLRGYFQSYKYFEKNKNLILKVFSEPEHVSKTINDKYDSSVFADSVSLHVRRGDYKKFPDTHPICDVDYYKNALKKINYYKKIFIFSDDIEWCKNNLQFDNVIFVQEEDYVELYFMSKLSYNIIANSSFSWWAAWMNTNINKKVIYPSRWFGSSGPQDTQDLHPKEWIKCY